MVWEVLVRLEISNIINKHAYQPAIILGHAPSLDAIKDDLLKYKEAGYILMGVNQWFDLYPTVPNYWTMASTVDTPMNYMKVINTCKLDVLYADSVDLVDKEWLDTVCENDYLAFDQRHFKGKECSVCNTFGCSKYLNTRRLTLQEELMKYTKSNFHYGSGSTGCLHACAFAILMGCDPIYITGIKLDYRVGYANRLNPDVSFSPDVKETDFDELKDSVLIDFQTIKNSAANINRNIFSLADDCLPGIFERKDLDG